jgi:hypothetical protein
MYHIHARLYFRNVGGLVLGTDPGGTVSLGVLEIAYRQTVALTAVRPEFFFKGFL